MERRRDGKPRNHPQPDIHERAEDINRAWELKGRGWSQAQIAEEMDVAQSTICKWLAEAYKAQMPPAAERERLLMIEQYDYWIGRIRGEIEAGVDTDQLAKLLDRLERFMAGTRKLQGLDAARKFEVTAKAEVGTKFDADLEELHRAFEKDQDIRNVARSRRRNR